MLQHQKIPCEKHQKNKTQIYKHRVYAEKVGKLWEDVFFVFTQMSETFCQQLTISVELWVKLLEPQDLCE